MLDKGQKILGRYVLGELSGNTESAHVYDATNEEVSRDVVVKVLRSGYSEQQARRFEREAKMMSQIMHPNVVGLQAFGMVNNNHPAIVMERYEGQSLKERLADRGAMSWPQAVHLMLGVLSGLEAVHAAGVVHRNISPDSIVVVDDERRISKLINLELAIPSVGYHSRLTWSAEFEDYAAYCAPEMLLDEPSSACSDVYSAAACLYEALSGRRAVEISGLGDLKKTLDQPVPPPQAPSGRPALPELLVAALLNALEKSPSRRTQTARGFADDLRAAHRSAMREQRLVAPKRAINHTAMCCAVVVKSMDPELGLESIHFWIEAQLGARGWVRTTDGCVLIFVPCDDEVRAERIAAALMGALLEQYPEKVRCIWTATAGLPMAASMQISTLPSEVADIIELLEF